MRRLIMITALLTATSAVADDRPSFDTRRQWSEGTSPFEPTHPPIPYYKLHAKALEILKTIPAIPPVVAKDDAAADADSCVAFKKTPMEVTTCK